MFSAIARLIRSICCLGPIDNLATTLLPSLCGAGFSLGFASHSSLSHNKIDGGVRQVVQKVLAKCVHDQAAFRNSSFFSSLRQSLFRQRLASSQSSWVSTAVAVEDVSEPRKPERRQARQP